MSLEMHIVEEMKALRADGVSYPDILRRVMASLKISANETAPFSFSFSFSLLAMYLMSAFDMSPGGMNVIGAWNVGKRSDEQLDVILTSKLKNQSLCDKYVNTVAFLVQELKPSPSIHIVKYVQGLLKHNQWGLAFVGLCEDLPDSENGLNEALIKRASELAGLSEFEWQLLNRLALREGGTS